MIFDIMGVEEELPQFSGDSGGLYAIDLIGGLHGGGEMDAATDAADGGDGTGHLFDGQSHEEFLKAPEFDNLEEGLVDIAGIIEKYCYFSMTFQTGHRIYFYLFHGIYSLVP
jgi:hypothetical protein